MSGIPAAPRARARAGPGRSPVRFAIVTLLLALLPAACGRHRPAATQPTPLPPPLQVSAVWPPPRSTAVPYDSLEIWAEFTEPLDPTTVTPLNVFLKIDTRRLAVSVRWDGARRRIVVSPPDIVQLAQTYTVQLSPNLRSVTGVPLGSTWSWQFTVNSVRRPRGPVPANGTVGESPFSSLAWTGNGYGDGAASYEVFAGRDSAAVAARALPVIYAGLLTHILPGARWPQDGPVYWAVNTVSPTTGEHLRGPVWRFTTVPASLPVDSLQVPLSFTNYGWLNQDNWAQTVCKGSEFLIGSIYTSGIVWDFSGVPRNVRLAGARMSVTASPGYENAVANSQLSIWYTLATWSCTRIVQGGTPQTIDPDGRLAWGRADTDGRVRFESDTLTSHIEACLRLTGYYGYMLRSNTLVSCATQTDLLRTPRLTLYLYRLPAAPADAAARGRPATPRGFGTDR